MPVAARTPEILDLTLKLLGDLQNEPPEVHEQICVFAKYLTDAGASDILSCQPKRIVSRNDPKLSFIRIPLTNMQPRIIDMQNDRETWMLQLLHGTTVAGLQGILKDRAMKTLDWDKGGVGHHAIYGKGTLHSDQISDEVLLALQKMESHPKNMCDFVVQIETSGKHKTMDVGGITEEARHVTPHQFVHNRSDKRWCVHPEAITFVAIWLTNSEHYKVKQDWSHKPL